MKKAIIITLLALLISTTAMAASFSIDEEKEIDLNGINRIIFELNHPRCALCISTGNQFYSLNGGGSNGKLELSLEGDLRSNNKKAVPELITKKTGSVLTIMLYKDSGLFFGLVQSGSLHFNAVLPEYFDGDLEILTSSGDTTATNINSRDFFLKSSSGDVMASGIEAERIELSASSGNTEAEGLSATSSLKINSSSGDIALDELISDKAEVRASSGRIEIGRLRSVSELMMHSSSGRISAESLSSGDTTIEASSGKINIGSLISGRLMIDSSSGDIEVSKLKAENADIHASSGKIRLGITELNSDINIKSNSGDVDLKLAAGTEFSVDLEASSGKIKSDFRILGEIDGSRKNEVIGDINGGGPTLKIRVSSGDITIKEN